VSGLFALAEREKRVLALIFMLGCCLAVAFVMVVYVLGQWLREAMTPWVFFSGHVVAALAVVAALVYFHGRLMRRFPESVQ
jgi:cyanate permease